MNFSHQNGDPLRVAFGYASAHFLPANSATTVRHDNAWVLILAYSGVALGVLLPLLEAVVRTRRPLAIFCPDIDPELRNTLIVNHQQGALRNVLIDAAATAEYDRAQLFAIAATTGAPILGSDRMLSRTTVDMLGEVDTITVGALSTVLSGFPLLRVG